ncbi:MAG: esterase [Epsilonproteobacteria bacterium]|nr:esterase [Campylobacterota bacterium]
MDKYIYIHGFGGSGLGIKASLFREHYADTIVCPSLSYVPALAIDTLKQLIEQMIDHATVTLIGSSLGGYYATYLSEHYGIKAVLINPSIQPYDTLQKVLGNAFNYYDESHFEWNEQHVHALRQYEVQTITPQQYMVLLQTGDELLDYRQAQRKFEDATVIVEEGGNHSYENIESKFTLIDSFAQRSSFL